MHSSDFFSDLAKLMREHEVNVGRSLKPDMLSFNMGAHGISVGISVDFDADDIEAIAKRHAEYK
jgi:hypothetical protein